MQMYMETVMTPAKQTLRYAKVRAKWQTRRNKRFGFSQRGRYYQGRKGGMAVITSDSNVKEN